MQAQKICLSKETWFSLGCDYGGLKLCVGMHVEKLSCKTEESAELLQSPAEINTVEGHTKLFMFAM